MDALSLVQSIWKQCKRIRREDESNPLKNWEEAKTWMQAFEWPDDRLIVLVFDSVDQLTAQHMALDRLADWLPGLQRNLRANIRVILSTLPADKNIDLRSQFENNGVNILEAHPFDPSDPAAVLEGLRIMCANKPASGTIVPLKRELSSATEAILLDLISNIDSSPLFISVALDAVCSWPSYHDVNASGKELKDTAEKDKVRGLIDQMFRQLEEKHGSKLVSSLLGMITLAKEGLSEGEAEVGCVCICICLYVFVITYHFMLLCIHVCIVCMHVCYFSLI